MSAKNFDFLRPTLIKKRETVTQIPLYVCYVLLIQQVQLLYYLAFQQHHL
jgi:uncharacterized membrane protein